MHPQERARTSGHLPLPTRLLVALLLGLLLWAGPAEAADSLDAEVRRFEAIALDPRPGVDELQVQILDRIVAHDNAKARTALKGLLARYGAARRGVAARILGALAAIATRDEVDHILRYVERKRDPLLQEALATILRRVDDPAARKHLRDTALPAAMPAMKVGILGALAEMRDTEAMFAMLSLLRSGTTRIKVAALDALGALQDSGAAPLIQVTLRDEDPRVRTAAARALGTLRVKTARPALESVLADEEPRTAEAAAKALAVIGDPASIDPLIEALARVQRKDMRLEYAFGHALTRITGHALGIDAEIWRKWWQREREKPFKRGKASDPTTGKGGARYYGFRILSSRVIFVLDVSRSMGWNRRLISAKQELQRVLDRLPPTTQFNLLVYSDAAETWKRRLVPANGRNVEAALRYVEKQKPVNGTNTYDALMTAIDDPKVDTIFFLSDGNPSVASAGGITDPELILAAVRAKNRMRGVRIHCIAIMRGEPPPAYQGREHPERMERFMKRLARENDGHYRGVR